MPTLKVNGAEIHYESHGGGPETVVFAHGLLWSGRMFDDQVNALKNRYRCITFDFRGQGQSEVTRSGYDIETLTGDAVALIEALEISPCHFAGLSMGGIVGLRLAIHQPHLLKSLILIESSADPEPPEKIRRYKLLNVIARWLSLRLVAGPVMAIMFGQKFLNDPARAELREEWRQRLLANDRIGVTRAVEGTIRRAGIYDQLDQITTPTLIIVGDQDAALGPAHSERMHARIPNSKLVIIPGAGHTSTVEEPEAVNDALAAFLGAAT
jgi:3-oxoadipate enol-lactonase